MTPEPFVSAETAAEFVLVKRRYLLCSGTQGACRGIRIRNGSRADELGLSSLRAGGCSRRPQNADHKERKIRARSRC